MPRLTDTQLVILSSAAKHDDGAALPLPKSLKVKGGAQTSILKSLLKRGLVAEQPAPQGAPQWREAEDGQRLTLVITDAGRAALGVESDEQAAAQPEAAAARSPQRQRRSSAKPKPVTKAKAHAKPKARSTASHAAGRSGTKQALLLELLRRKQGATIAEAMKATGWQPHSVRGAISGTLKKKLGLAIASETVEGRGRVYRISMSR
jgi:DNA-binding MarR family transcriptional regulator